MVDMKRGVNKFLVNVMCPCVVPVEIYLCRFCVLECRGEQSPRAQSHGSVPGGGG